MISDVSLDMIYVYVIYICGYTNKAVRGHGVGEFSFLFVVVYALYSYGIGYMGHVLRRVHFKNFARSLRTDKEYGMKKLI